MNKTTRKPNGTTPDNLTFARWISAEMAKRDPEGMRAAKEAVDHRMKIVRAVYRARTTKKR